MSKLINQLETLLAQLNSSKSTNKPKNNKNNKNGTKRKNGNGRGRVLGTNALGTNVQGPLMLKNEQFATYAPLQTFAVTSGSTPGGTRVRGRELIQSLTSGGTTLLYGAAGVAGTAGSILLHPASFPRLTSYVGIYEMYIFHSAKVMFQSNQPTTASGVSILSADYDAKDAAPTSTVLQMRNISSSMSNIYADNAMIIDKKLSRLPRYITAVSVGTDADQLYQANLFYGFEGVVGVAASQGYLVIQYDVEFFTPQ